MLKPVDCKQERDSSFTKSKAAIFFFSSFTACSVPSVETWYLPTSKLFFTIRHFTVSGSFNEAGLKKLETAFSVKSETLSFEERLFNHIRVVVEDCFRFEGGGEMSSGDDARFMKLIFGTVREWMGRSWENAHRTTRKGGASLIHL
jgi:hypothetical protein